MLGFLNKTSNNLAQNDNGNKNRKKKEKQQKTAKKGKTNHVKLRAL